MADYTATAQWNGTFKNGNGNIRVGSGACDVSLAPRPEEGTSTNPEETLGGALAACYSLILARALGDAGHEPKSIRTEATVSLRQQQGQYRIARIGLDVEVDADGLSEDRLRELSHQADEGCPISQALSGTSIEIDARLAGVTADR